MRVQRKTKWGIFMSIGAIGNTAFSQQPQFGGAYNLTAKQMIRALERKGFELARQNGSHAIYRLKQAGGQTSVTVPMKKRQMSTGTAQSIAKKAGLTLDELA